MSGGEGPGGGRPATTRERQGVIDALCEHYAQDHLALAEFERRLDRANRVAGAEELIALVRDLPPLGRGEAGREGPGAGGEERGGGEGRRRGEAGRPAGDLSRGGGAHELTVPPGAGRVDAGRVADSQLEVAFWSGRTRSGSWIPARTIRAVAFMGGVELDFREALFGPDDVRVHAVAVMGGIEIVVPPGVHVDTSGFALLGGFEEQLEGGGDLPPGAPVLRVTGAAVMGAVEVVTRLPGESPADARRRRKDRAKRLRRDETRPRLRPGGEEDRR